MKKQCYQTKLKKYVKVIKEKIQLFIKYEISTLILKDQRVENQHT